MRTLSAVAVTALLPALLVSGPAPATTPTHCPVHLAAPAHSKAAIQALGDALPRAARSADMTPTVLRQRLRTDPALWLDTCGNQFYVEPANPAKTTAEQPAPTASEALTLHSRPGSKHTLYIDVDGYSVTDGNYWAETFGAFDAAGYSMDADPAFNDSELARIADIWRRVSEDYAPFDLDVTTEDPGEDALTRTSPTDDTFGTRVAIVGGNPIYNSCLCGGIAFVDVFDETVDHDLYQPAFAFTSGIGTGSKNLTEAVSHEAGHNLGLYHDGTSSLPYYRGQGLWAPIMGVGYDKPLSQWSRGEYTSANNTEDDLAIIADSGAPLAPDDFADTRAGAADLADNAAGIIGTPTDTDWFRFTAYGGTTVSAQPQTSSPDLDIRLDLYDSSGSVLSSSNPRSSGTDRDVATGLGASVTAVLPPGTYYASVDGAGAGSAVATGYSDYGSLGHYVITMTTESPADLTLTQQVLREATQGRTYAATITATGGTAPYTFRVAAGSLPDGLMLNPNGELAGTPTAPGSSDFAIEVTDARSARDTADFAIDVASGPSPDPTPQPLVFPTPTPTASPATVLTLTPIRVTTKSLPRARVGKRYRARLRASTAVTWRLAAGRLPKGTRLSDDGRLVGKPKKRGRFRFVVMAASGGQSTAAHFTLRVRRARR